MNKIIINEKEYVENILESYNLPQDVTPMKFVVYLTKYFYSDNKSLDEVMDEVLDVISNFTFSVIEYEEYKATTVIKNTYNRLQKNKISRIRDFSYVPIYNSELEIINNCDNKIEQKMLFTIYVLARFTNSFGWIYQNRNEIYKLSNVSRGNKTGNKVIHDLYMKKLIKLTKKVDDDKIGIPDVYLPINNEEPVLKIYELNNIGNQYINYIDSNKKLCERCNKLIKLKYKNKNRYCEKCAIIVNREKTRNRMKMLRESKAV